METEKKAYQKPTLTIHGDVRVLTETHTHNKGGFGLSCAPGDKKDGGTSFNFNFRR